MNKSAREARKPTIYEVQRQGLRLGLIVDGAEAFVSPTRTTSGQPSSSTRHNHPGLAAHNHIKEKAHEDGPGMGHGQENMVKPAPKTRK